MLKRGNTICLPREVFEDMGTCKLCKQVMVFVRPVYMKLTDKTYLICTACIEDKGDCYEK